LELDAPKFAAFFRAHGEYILHVMTTFFVSHLTRPTIFNQTFSSYKRHSLKIMSVYRHTETSPQLETRGCRDKEKFGGVIRLGWSGRWAWRGRSRRHQRLI